MSEQDQLEAAIRTISEKYLPKALRAKNKAAILKWTTRLADYTTRLAALVVPPLKRGEAADLGEPDVAVNLSIPSSDTVGLLNQWLYAKEDPERVPAGSLFARNGDADIVQLVAAIVGHGSAFYLPGDVSAETLALARMLNAPGNIFNLYPLYLASLESGEPEYARSLGIASDSIVGA